MSILARINTFRSVANERSIRNLSPEQITDGICSRTGTRRTTAFISRFPMRLELIVSCLEGAQANLTGDAF